MQARRTHRSTGRPSRVLLRPMQDFSIGFVLVPIVCGLTLGQIGGEEHGENFFYQLQHSHVSPAMPSPCHVASWKGSPLMTSVHGAFEHGRPTATDTESQCWATDLQQQLHVCEAMHGCHGRHIGATASGCALRPVGRAAGGGLLRRLRHALQCLCISARLPLVPSVHGAFEHGRPLATDH